MPKKPSPPKKKSVPKAAKKASAKKAATPRKPPPKAKPILRAAGEQLYWLLKTEPSTFSYADIAKAPGATTGWDGVRNYQARNYLRDSMKIGDGVFIYHSNAEPPAIVGVAEVAREGYPDATQFDSRHDHFDPGAKLENPPWIQIDVRAKQLLPRPLSLPELREIPGLSRMVLLQKGSRLSVQPVAAAEWAIILKAAGA